MSPFGGPTWLDRFKEGGGWWIANHRLSMGWRLDSELQALEARRLYERVANDPARLESLKALLGPGQQRGGPGVTRCVPKNSPASPRRSASH